MYKRNVGFVCGENECMPSAVNLQLEELDNVHITIIND